MSFTTHSPPETPSKQIMAVETETLNSKSQVPDLSSKGDIKVSRAQTEDIDLAEPVLEAQIPSTHPSNALGDDSVPAPQSNQGAQVEELRPDHRTEKAEDDRQMSADNSSATLPPKDWDEFEGRYKNAILKANDEEDALLEEFEKYVNVFTVWAFASAQHDNDRGWKRLKTRGRFVELAESQLAEKKEHYVEVVAAFQKALDLLRR